MHAWATDSCIMPWPDTLRHTQHDKQWQHSLCHTPGSHVSKIFLTAYKVFWYERCKIYSRDISLQFYSFVPSLLTLFWWKPELDIKPCFYKIKTNHVLTNHITVSDSWLYLIMNMEQERLSDLRNKL